MISNTILRIINYKAITPLLLLIAISFASYSQKQIRNANWGWPKDSVKKSERLKLLSDSKDELVYSGELANKKFNINYLFTKNKLTKVYYIYSENHINPNNYISSYENLQDILTKKYGEAIIEKINWKNDLYKDDIDKWGFACSAGHVIFISKWENDDTDITLICTGDNFHISLGIIYDSKEYKSLIKNEEEDKNNKDF